MDKLKVLRKNKSLTQAKVASILGISQAAYSKYEIGKSEPDNKSLAVLADLFDVSIDYLIGNLHTSNTDVAVLDRKVSRIPVLGSIPAGVPIDAVEDILDYEDIPERWLHGNRSYFALKIKGDSMSPRYLDGDVVIFEKDSTCNSGQNCAVMVNGDDVTFKKVILHESGITLQPLNPTYEPLFFTNEEIANKPITIIGIAKETRRSE
ncbi:MAG: LexA family transcriptional regulator [Bacillota bacterium]